MRRKRPGGVVWLWTGLALCSGASAQVNGAFSFTETTPVQLDWLTFTKGYKVRVQNTSTKTIPSLVARIKPGDGFVSEDLKLIELQESSSCPPPLVRPWEPCRFTLGRLYEMQPGASNVFTIKLDQGVAVNQFPGHKKQYVLTVKSTEHASISRTLIVNPPTIQAPMENKYINLYTLRVFGVDIFNDLRLFGNTSLLYGSLKFICNKSRLGENFCVTNSNIAVSQESLNLESFGEITFRKKDEASQDLKARLVWGADGKQIDIEFDPGQPFEEGDYAATLARVRGPDPDSKAVSVVLRVRSAWYVTCLLILLGLMLAVVTRIVQGSAAQRMLRRIDALKLDLTRKLGLRNRPFGHTFRGNIYEIAWLASQKVQALRSSTPDTFETGADYLEVQQRVQDLEAICSGWKPFIARLDAAHRVIRSASSQGNSSSPDPALAAVLQQVRQMSSVDLTASPLDQRWQAAAAWIEEIQSSMAAAEALAPRLNLPTVPLRKTGIVYPVDILIVGMSTIIALVFVLTRYHTLLQDVEKWVVSAALVGTVGVLLCIWLWPRMLWICTWYWNVLHTTLYHNPFPLGPERTRLRVNWWDTLPVWVGLGVALINGLEQFYLQTTATPLVHQLSLVAWGFGSTAAVQGFFVLLEKSPLGRRF